MRLAPFRASMLLLAALAVSLPLVSVHAHELYLPDHGADAHGHDLCPACSVTSVTAAERPADSLVPLDGAESLVLEVAAVARGRAPARSTSPRGPPAPH